MKINNLLYFLIFNLLLTASTYATNDSYLFELSKIPRKDFIKVHKQYINFVIQEGRNTKYPSFIESKYSWWPNLFEAFPGLISSCYASTPKLCLFGGWVSKRRFNGSCITPWKAKRFAKSQKVDSYGPKCGSSNLFRCNSTLFGPGPSKQQMKSLNLRHASGVGQNHNEKGGICVDTGGSYNEVTKKCVELSEKLDKHRGKSWLEEMNDKDFKKYYKSKFEPLKNTIDKFCNTTKSSESNKTCKGLKTKVKTILEKHKLRSIAKTASKLPTITSIKVKRRKCSRDLSSTSGQLQTLKPQKRRIKHTATSHSARSKEIRDPRKERSALSNCKVLNKNSCLYLDNNITYKDDTIVIYHRGFWGKYKGKVPTKLRKRSIKQALSKYDLNRSSDKLKIPFLVSTSSNVGFSIKEIESSIKKAKLKENAKVILASHSGGYLGLIKTLKNLKKGSYTFKIENIVMLDNFYFSSRSAGLLKEFFDKGVKCTGFYTEHNSKRLKSVLLKKVDSEVCSIEKRRGHNKSVNDCLVSYVNGEKCVDGYVMKNHYIDWSTINLYEAFKREKLHLSINGL